MPEEEFYEDEEQIEGEEELDLPPGEPQTFGEKVMAATPWWGISTGSHIVVVLILAYLIVLGQPPREDDMAVISPPRQIREVPEMEDPPDIQNKKKLDIDKAVEDPVFKKDAEEADHNETEDDEEFENSKRDTIDFVTDKPFQGKGT